MKCTCKTGKIDPLKILCKDHNYGRIFQFFSLKSTHSLSSTCPKILSEWVLASVFPTGLWAVWLQLLSFIITFSSWCFLLFLVLRRRSIHVYQFEDYESFRDSNNHQKDNDYCSSYMAPFLFRFFLNFIFKEREREVERKGEKHWWAHLPLHTPTLGPGLYPRHVPWPGIEPVSLHFVGWCPIRSATPARAHMVLT